MRRTADWVQTVIIQNLINTKAAFISGFLAPYELYFPNILAGYKDLFYIFER
jgi:hypothetical protein